MPNYQKYLKFNNKIYIIGFGSIGRAVLPLLLRHLEITPSQITIITKDFENINTANEYKVNFNSTVITKENYKNLFENLLNEGDFVLNLSVDVASVALIKLCQQKNVLYLDTCIEPWPGTYVDKSLSPSLRSNYALRESILKIKKDNTSTALVTHGANPGLVSHFVKQALINIAKDNNLAIKTPESKTQWAELAKELSIKVMHIAECDTQIANQPKKPGEFVNTWSVDGFVAEGLQPSELGWGSHEKHWPEEAYHHDYGTQCAVYLNKPGADTLVRSWTPQAGSYRGYLITHGESISIADYFTLKTADKLIYRPTVHYAYRPCPDAVLSLHELAGKEWQQQEKKRIMFEEITDGFDELGVLLMGNKKGAYWFGSQLSIHEARKLAPHNTATSLQVAIGVLSGMIWVIQNPNCGVVEPDDIDYKKIMEISAGYLGNLIGVYTDWTPTNLRERLFSETRIDKSDPLQFKNFLVD